MRTALLILIASCTSSDTDELHAVDTCSWAGTTSCELACSEEPTQTNSTVCETATNPTYNDSAQRFGCTLGFEYEGVGGCCVITPDAVARFYRCE